MRDDLLAVVFAFCVALMIGLGIWLSVAAPCQVYQWSPAADIPGRCVMPHS